MTIGNRIAELRKSKGYSQEYVAEKLGISRQAVSKWEMDQTSPDTNNLIAIAELFDVSVEYIATGKKVVFAEETRPPEPITVIHEVERTPRANITTQKILGFILLAAGLISLILGILLEYILLIPAAILLIAAIVFLAVKKAPVLWLSWTYLAVFFLGISTLSRINPFRGIEWMITSAFSGEMTWDSLVGGAFVIWIGINIVVTVILLTRSEREQYEEKRKNKE